MFQAGQRAGTQSGMGDAVGESFGPIVINVGQCLGRRHPGPIAVCGIGETTRGHVCASTRWMATRSSARAPKMPPNVRSLPVKVRELPSNSGTGTATQGCGPFPAFVA
jgi:hypothetical protein